MQKLKIQLSDTLIMKYKDDFDKTLDFLKRNRLAIGTYIFLVVIISLLVS